MLNLKLEAWSSTFNVQRSTSIVNHRLHRIHVIIMQAYMLQGKSHLAQLRISFQNYMTVMTPVQRNFQLNIVSPLRAMWNVADEMSSKDSKCAPVEKRTSWTIPPWQDIQPWCRSLCPKPRVQNTHLWSRESLAPWDHWQQRKFVDRPHAS